MVHAAATVRRDVRALGAPAAGSADAIYTVLYINPNGDVSSSTLGEVWWWADETCIADIY